MIVYDYAAIFIGENMAKNNYYAVAAGRQTGIFKAWSECQKQVVGFKGAKFKGFVTLDEAKAFMGEYSAQAQENFSFDQGTVIFVDGSFRDNKFSWGFAAYIDGVLTYTDNGVGTSPEAAKLRNVAGEMNGAIEAALWAEANGFEPIVLCHDYEGIAAWPLKHWQAKLPQTQAYVEFMQPRLGWIKFHKVAAHTGIEGNELADRLAKEALGI